jgi:hypothetical protein
MLIIKYVVTTRVVIVFEYMHTVSFTIHADMHTVVTIFNSYMCHSDVGIIVAHKVLGCIRVFNTVWTLLHSVVKCDLDQTTLRICAYAQVTV